MKYGEYIFELTRLFEAEEEVDMAMIRKLSHHTLMLKSRLFCVVKKIKPKNKACPKSSQCSDEGNLLKRK